MKVKIIITCGLVLMAVVAIALLPEQNNHSPDTYNISEYEAIMSIKDYLPEQYSEIQPIFAFDDDDVYFYFIYNMWSRRR